jgi:protease I
MHRNQGSSVHIAILAGIGADVWELSESRQELNEAGAEVVVVSPAASGGGPGLEENLQVDADLHGSTPAAFDGVLIVGDQASTQSLRRDPDTAAFLRHFFRNEKPVAALDHGAAVVLEVADVYGRRLTSAESLKEDAGHAGARWLDSPMVVDGNLITGRSVDDTGAVSRQLVRQSRRARMQRGIRRHHSGWWSRLVDRWRYRAA